MEQNVNTSQNTINDWFSFKSRLILRGILVGIITGLITVLFRFMIEQCGKLSNQIYNLIKQNYILAIPWFIALILLALLVSYLMKSEPMISGSGIPQVKGELIGELDSCWWKILFSKFIGGVIALFAGLSVGREGPSVQMGAYVGKGVGKAFKSLKVEEKYLMTSGSSAGLAAAFNAPLSGVIFALEEAHKSFSPFVLLSAMGAALSADYTSKLFYGRKTIFDFGSMATIPLDYYFLLIILGCILGAAAALFNSTLLKTQDLYNKITNYSVPLKLISVFLTAGILGLILPHVLGGGHILIEEMQNRNFSIIFLISLLVVKFLFTMISYGSGSPGGIFLPLLVIGALIGTIFAEICMNFMDIPPSYITNFIVLGMAGYFTAIVRAPITGIILITEMTGNFSHLLGLAVISLAAFFVADFLGSHPIYESLLEKMLSNLSNNKNSSENTSNEKILLDVPVEMGSFLDGKLIKDVKWPEESLLVSLRRGEKDIIPKGNTKIFNGDYLVILTDSDTTFDVYSQVNKHSTHF